MTQDFSPSSSGAWIWMDDQHVIKTGDGRVGQRIDEQVRWLKEMRGADVVTVTASAPHTLVMPRLEPLPYTHVSDVFTAVLGALETVWKREPRVVTPYFRQLAVFENRACTYFGSDVLKRMEALEVQIKWDQLRTCRTHGDPTFCNVMWGGRALLIDPLPADDRVPDFRAVDLAKLLQSCYGWEDVAHPEMPYVYDRGWTLVRDVCEDDHEWVATRYWLLVHLARLVPYYANHDGVMRWAQEVADRVCGL